MAGHHPGEILMREDLEPLGITQHGVAVAIGVLPRQINEIVHGKRGITADTALRLARALRRGPARSARGDPRSDRTARNCVGAPLQRRKRHGASISKRAACWSRKPVE
jgi:addiction module HigA family antidote